jgi:hypothetical protein
MPTAQNNVGSLLFIVPSSQPIMRVCRFFSIFFLAFVVQSGQAMTIRGAPTCGGWLTQRSAPEGESTELAWIVGFLSGLAIGFNEDILAPVDNADISTWLDAYCRAHPLDSFASVGQKLFVDLAKKQNRLP